MKILKFSVLRDYRRCWVDESDILILLLLPVCSARFCTEDRTRSYKRCTSSFCLGQMTKAIDIKRS